MPSDVDVVEQLVALVAQDVRAAALAERLLLADAAGQAGLACAGMRCSRAVSMP